MKVKGKTKTGFKFEVDKDQLSNWELLEKIAEMQHGDGMAAFEVLGILLGKDQKKRLYDHCRDDKGMVPVDAITAELTDITNALAEANETKN